MALKMLTVLSPLKKCCPLYYTKINPGMRLTYWTLENVKYIFIYIIPRFTLIDMDEPVMIPSVAEIDLFKNYSYLSVPCAKNMNE